jgi:thiol-disulfide isomerase/thioredoxin
MDRRLKSCLLVAPIAICLAVTSTTRGESRSFFRNPFRKSEAPSPTRDTTSGQLAEGAKKVPPQKPGPTKSVPKQTKVAAHSKSASAIRSAPTKPVASNLTTAKIRWQTDLKEARAISVQDNRPLLIVFGAEWCTFCHKLERQTLSDPELVEYINTKFVPVKLDVEEHKRIASVLEVESLPASVILSPKADLLGTITGYFDKPEYQASLSDALILDQKLQQTPSVAAQ